jgi:hypothetical protein
VLDESLKVWRKLEEKFDEVTGKVEVIRGNLKLIEGIGRN